MNEILNVPLLAHRPQYQYKSSMRINQTPNKESEFQQQKLMKGKGQFNEDYYFELQKQQQIREQTKGIRITKKFYQQSEEVPYKSRKKMFKELHNYNTSMINLVNVQNDDNDFKIKEKSNNFIRGQSNQEFSIYKNKNYNNPFLINKNKFKQYPYAQSHINLKIDYNDNKEVQNSLQQKFLQNDSKNVQKLLNPCSNMSSINDQKQIEKDPPHKIQSSILNINYESMHDKDFRKRKSFF